MRPHPDGRQVRQFLKELRLPLAASEGMLELMQAVELPQTARMALAAVRNHNDFVQHLIGDYVEFGRLEQGAVAVQAVPWDVCDWIETVLAEERARAAALGLDLVVDFQTLLPSHVTFDGGLVARALSAVLHVAMQRALPGRLDLSLRFEEADDMLAGGRFVCEITSTGGGFSEMEQAYVFAPFQVRDAAARPLLGLVVAQRLAQLLGGELCVESPGAAICSYRMTVLATPSDAATWKDPASQDACHGPVQPGVVLFVGRSATAAGAGRDALEAAGYSVEQVECGEVALAQLGEGLARWSAIVLDETCTGDTTGGFLDALRALGFAAPVISLAGASVGLPDSGTQHTGSQDLGPQDCAGFVEGSDRLLADEDGEHLVAVLRELRTYRDRKNATSAC